MNTTQLAEAAQDLFRDLEDWETLFELHDLSVHIQEQWLCRGAEAIRECFRSLSLDGVVCEFWGNPRDNRWYLEGLGPDSLGIGIGWSKLELHLFAPNSRSLWQSKDMLVSRLKDPMFKPLIENFDPARPPWSGEGVDSFAINGHFNPVGSQDNQGDARVREMAWFAGNKTDEYAERMSSFVKRMLTGESVKLLLQLNEEFGAGAR